MSKKIGQEIRLPMTPFLFLSLFSCGLVARGELVMTLVGFNAILVFFFPTQQRVEIGNALIYLPGMCFVFSGFEETVPTPSPSSASSWVRD